MTDINKIKTLNAEIKNIVYSDANPTGTMTRFYNEDMEETLLDKTEQQNELKQIDWFAVDEKARAGRDEKNDQNTVWRLVSTGEGSENIIEEKIYIDDEDLLITGIDNGCVIKTEDSDEQQEITEQFEQILLYQNMIVQLVTSPISLSSIGSGHYKKAVENLHRMQVLEFEMLQKYLRGVDLDLIDFDQDQYLLFTDEDTQYIIRFSPRMGSNYLEPMGWLHRLAITTRKTSL